MSQYIQDTLRNNLKSIVKTCTVPQQKAVHEVVRGLFLKHTPILRHLAQHPKHTVKKQAEKYAYHLGHIELTPQVEKHALRQIKSSLTNDTIIAYDLTDIAKESAQCMEKLSRVFDGSKRKPTNGYTLHGVGVHDMLLKFEVHDGAAQTLSQVRRRVVEELSSEFEKQGIWVFDRGNDHKSFFVSLRHELNVRFVARIKENRHVVVKETGEKCAVKCLAPGKYEVYLMNRYNTHVDTRCTYTLIISKHLEDKEPIRLLSSLPLQQYTEQEFVTIYLERWGVESSFRRAKQKFQLERIRVRSYQKFINLVALIQFAVNVSRMMFLALQKTTSTLVVGVILFYKRFIRLKNLTFTTDSFISYLGEHLTPLLRRKTPPPLQLSLLSWRQLGKLGSS